jgi:hypothetical protein
MNRNIWKSNFWPLVFIGALGLLLAWPPVPAVAQLGREQLHNLSSSLEVLRERLANQRALLSSDVESNNFSWSMANAFFSETDEVQVAFESALIGATAEDRAKAANLLEAVKRLDEAGALYLAAVRKIGPSIFLSRPRPAAPRPKLGPVEAERNEADRERLVEFFLALAPDSPDESLKPLENKGQRSSARPGMTGAEKSGADQEKMPALSGNTARGLADDVSLQDAQIQWAEEQLKRARKEAWSIWHDLDSQYRATLDQIDQLLDYFQKQ